MPSLGRTPPVLATPVGEDPHPLDWVPDTWLRCYWVAVGDEDLTAAA
jgi:hypothetical protein